MIHSIPKPDITIRQVIKDAIAEGFDEQTEFLSEFVRIPSLRFQEGPAQDFMADALRQRDFLVDDWKIILSDLEIYKKEKILKLKIHNILFFY